MNWRKWPLDSRTWPELANNPLPFAGLLTSLPDEFSYTCEVDGELPDLRGTLYRIGPGLYDRGPDRKRMMLDGDGMVQALQFDRGTVTFRNRFVRTPKYLQEARAGRFLYPTFSCHGSGPMRYNLGLSLPNQANTTVLAWAGRLLAFDEGQVPFELSHSLDTLGQRPVDLQQPGLAFHAHWKLDAVHHQVHYLAISQGRRPVAHVVSMDRQGRIARRHHIRLPRSVYIHDWFVSARYFAFLLHPAFIDLYKLLQVLIGKETFSEAIQWQPRRGNLLVIVDRADGATRTVELPACWMWHAINAFDDGRNLTLDFIGSEQGGGLGDADSPLFRIMKGQLPGTLDEPGNFPRRYEIDLTTGACSDTLLASDANFELPGLSATERARPHSWVCMIRSEAGELFPGGLTRLHAGTLEAETFRFGPGEYCGEPVFLDTLDSPKGRHLISQVYLATGQRSEFCVFDTDRFQAGPVATIHLQHHVPLSFHGFWDATDCRNRQL